MQTAGGRADNPYHRAGGNGNGSGDLALVQLMVFVQQKAEERRQELISIVRAGIPRGFQQQCPSSKAGPE